MKSFSMAIFGARRPGAASETLDAATATSTKRAIACFCDRGDPASPTNDIGAMELFCGSAAVSSDPFRVAQALSDTLADLDSSGK